MSLTPELYIESLNSKDKSQHQELYQSQGVFKDISLNVDVPASELSTFLERLDSTFAPVFSLRSGSSTDMGLVVEWTLTGKNVGPYRPNFEPTNKEFTLEGVDVVTLEKGQVAVTQRYFDSASLALAIGHQVIVEPYEQGGAEFGYSMHVSMGKSVPPGVVGLTWIEARDEAEKDEIRGFSRNIIKDFRETPGFLGIVTGFTGLRGFTVTAWETEEALRDGTTRYHARAMQAFRSEDVADGVWTSVWRPERLNRIWTRCPACKTPNDVNDDHRQCASCGAELPPRRTFW